MTEHSAVLVATAASAMTRTGSEKLKKGGLAGKLAGLSAKGRKVAAAAASVGNKVEKEATAAGGTVKGGRVLRKRA